MGRLGTCTPTLLDVFIADDPALIKELLASLVVADLCRGGGGGDSDHNPSTHGCIIASSPLQWLQTLPQQEAPAVL